MKKVIQFSKGFLPSAIISAVIIVFGIIGFFTKGINLGLDFKPGLVEEVRIAPVAINVTYSGSAKVILEISNEKLDVVVSGTGAENETKSFAFHEYPTVADLAKGISSVADVKAEVLADATEPSYTVFFNSAVSTQLSKEPVCIYAKSSDVTVDDVRAALSELKGISVKKIGSGSAASFQIRMSADSEEVTGASLQNDVMTKLEAKFGANKVAVIKTDFIGAGFSSSLAIKSAFLLLLTIVCIWIYAAFRFHWDFALGSVIALLHDVCIMFTFIIWSNMEFTTTVLAAILTIIGYSINATVVILDRVRDNLSMQKVTKFDEILNKSLSDTLARSILTTVTTLFAVVSLYIFTTGSIKDFALAVIVGLFSGCYSSIFISGGFISAGRKNWKPEFGVHHSEKSMKKGVLQMDSGVTV